MKRANSFFPFIPSAGGDAKTPPSEKKTSAVDRGLIYPTAAEGKGAASPTKEANKMLSFAVAIVAAVGLSVVVWRART